tara:strand:+ start:476 stop:610 length:135 start_codon:yes stop_codon:yes gene_type:complete
MGISIFSRFLQKKIVFTAINIRAAAEVITQYLIIFCPLLGGIWR